MIDSPAEPWTHQSASPHRPAVSLTPQWSPGTAALLPYAAARQPVNTLGHLKSVTDVVRRNKRKQRRYEKQGKHIFFLRHKKWLKVVTFHINALL